MCDFKGFCTNLKVFTLDAETGDKSFQPGIYFVNKIDILAPG
jgi:hypothetical protein